MSKHPQSTAVLTPELIHPNYFKKSGNWHTGNYRSPKHPTPVKQHEFEGRKRWCEQQLKTIGEFGAVLGGEA